MSYYDVLQIVIHMDTLQVRFCFLFEIMRKSRLSKLPCSNNSVQSTVTVKMGQRLAVIPMTNMNIMICTLPTQMGPPSILV